MITFLNTQEWKTKDYLKLHDGDKVLKIFDIRWTDSGAGTYATILMERKPDLTVADLIEAPRWHDLEQVQVLARKAVAALDRLH